MLTSDNLQKFKVALSEALRTTDQQDRELAKRFVELRPGIIDVLSANVNQLVTGRRGVGKSTNLAVLQQRAEAAGRRVIFVDVETHKERAYPDVLIEIVRDILSAVRPPKFSFGKRRDASRRVKKLILVLDALLDAGPELVTHSEETRSESKSSKVTLEGRAAKGWAALSASRGNDRTATKSRKTSSTVSKRKEDFLRDLAPALSAVLQDVAHLKHGGSLLLVLDDFYFVSTTDQPLVLDHLHGITKRGDVWLKIASVRSRTRTYVNGDPPLGMQPPNDYQEVPLDVGLSEFMTAKSFLENVASGVLKGHGFELHQILTDTARERAVLIAGGAVARDYIDLLISAADVAWERVQGQSSPADKFRIEAEDVQAAAVRRLDRKRVDLRSDAGVDSGRLEQRFADLVKFANDRDAYFFLVKADELDTEWGGEIVQLEDLRFVHRIMTARPNTATWRGIDTIVFMVDVPALVQDRMRRKIEEFWKPGESDQLRRAEWVYRPNWTTNKIRKSAGRPATPGSEPEPTGELVLPFE